MSQPHKSSTSFSTRVRNRLGRLARSGGRVAALERELYTERDRISRLEAELDELRRDSLRVAELIDLAEQSLTPRPAAG